VKLIPTHFYHAINIYPEWEERGKGCGGGQGGKGMGEQRAEKGSIGKPR